MNSLPDNFWGWVVYLLQQYGPSFLRGAGTTMLIAVISTAVGCLIGFGVGIVQTTPADKAHPVKYILMKLVRFLLDAYVEIFRGTPMMVQAMFIYYGLAQLFNIHLGTMEAALFIVSINTGAYMAETVRGGILSIDPGQTEGAKAIGMTHVQTMNAVRLPQALRNIMPQIGNNLIINIKDILCAERNRHSGAVLRHKERGGRHVYLLRGLHHNYGDILRAYLLLFTAPSPMGEQDGRSGQLRALRPCDDGYFGSHHRPLQLS